MGSMPALLSQPQAPPPSPDSPGSPLQPPGTPIHQLNTDTPQPLATERGDRASTTTRPGTSSGSNNSPPPSPSMAAPRIPPASPPNKRGGRLQTALDPPAKRPPRLPRPGPVFSDVQLSRLTSALLQPRPRAASGRARLSGLRTLRAGYADALDDVLQQPAVEATAGGRTVQLPSAGQHGQLWAHQLAVSGAARRVLYDLFGRHTRDLPSPEELDARAVARDFCSSLFSQYDQFCTPGPRRTKKRSTMTSSDSPQQDQQHRRSRNSNTQEGARGVAQ